MAVKLPLRVALATCASIALTTLLVGCTGLNRGDGPSKNPYLFSVSDSEDSARPTTSILPGKPVKPFSGGARRIDITRGAQSIDP